MTFCLTGVRGQGGCKDVKHHLAQGFHLQFLRREGAVFREPRRLFLTSSIHDIRVRPPLVTVRDFVGNVFFLFLDSNEVLKAS